MDTVEAKYYRKYVFPLRNITPEFVTFLQELKETLAFSPWFSHLVFRSLLEIDDRQHAEQELSQEYRLTLPNWEAYTFILMLKLKEPYHIKIMPQEKAKLVRRGETLLEDPLMMLTDIVPPKAKTQWERLIELIDQSNATTA